MDAPTRLSLGRKSSLACEAAAGAIGAGTGAWARSGAGPGAGAGAGAGAGSCLPKEILRVDCGPGVHDTDVGVGTVIPGAPKSTCMPYC